MSTAQEEIQSVFGKIPVTEALEKSFLVLADASSSSPNLRALEMVLTAIFVSRYSGEVITNFYHGATLGESSNKIGLWERNMEFDFKLDRNLLELHYKRLFGDPVQRMEHISEKMRSRGKSEDAIQQRLNSYLSTLPVAIFSNGQETFIEFIRRARIESTERIIDALNLERQGSYVVEVAADSYETITLRDVITDELDSEFLNDYHVAKFCCPECSLSNDGSQVEHGVSLTGEIFQSVAGVGQGGNLANGCKQVKTLRENIASQNILDIPIRDLINAGFAISGKVMFLLENMMFKNPNVAQAIRAYSNPRGTIAKTAAGYEGLTMLTPSLYICVYQDGKQRDANIFELLDFIQDSEGLALLSEFIRTIPLADDGIKRTLDISNKQILINEP